MLAGMTGGAVRENVSTTCIGFGAHFNEDLLQLMAPREVRDGLVAHD